MVLFHDSGIAFVQVRKNKKYTLRPKCTTWLIIYNLSDSLALLKKSEIYNVDTDAIFYMIFGFI